MPEQPDDERGPAAGATAQARLARQRDELRAELARVEGEIHRVTRLAQASMGPRTFRPVRGLVLDALDDLAWPTYTRELSAYAAARYARPISPTRFGALTVDEEKAYKNRHAPKSRPRTVWICYGLTWNHAEPIKRLLCRSDWPLERRVFAPTSGRVQYLRLTARLCEIAETSASTAADADMLRVLAADHARDLGGKVERGQFRLAEWRESALALLAEIEPRDEMLRLEAAQNLQTRLSEHALLFGAPEAIVGVDDAVRQGKLG